MKVGINRYIDESTNFELTTDAEHMGSIVIDMDRDLIEIIKLCDNMYWKIQNMLEDKYIEANKGRNKCQK